MPKKFKIPDNGSLIVSPGAGYYNASGKQAKEDFKVFFGDYFEAVLSNAQIGSKESPNTIDAQAYLTGGLYALDATTAVVDLPKPSEAVESKDQYVLRINQETQPETAYNKGKNTDAKWIKDCHLLIADQIINAIKHKFPQIPEANIKIEIVDCDGKNWFTQHPQTSLYGTGETLLTLRFNANRWEKLWEGKEKECAFRIGETFKCIEEGRKLAIQKSKEEKEVSLQDYLDPAHIEKLKALRNKHGQHYELKPEGFLLINHADYKFMCDTLHLPYDSFMQGFNQKSPTHQEALNAFRESNSATASYFLRQKQLTGNLTELKVSEGQESPEKSRLSGALHQTFSENLQFMAVEATTMPNGNLIYAVPPDKEPIQPHLVNLEAIVHSRQINFVVSYAKNNEPAGLEERRRTNSGQGSSPNSSAAGSPQEESILLKKGQNFKSSSSSASHIEDDGNSSEGSVESDKDNVLISDFLVTFYTLGKLTTSESIELPLPILKLFFAIVSWHISLLTRMTCETNNEEQLEIMIRNFCNAGVSILQHGQRKIGDDRELSTLVIKMIDFFAIEADSKNLGTTLQILKHIAALNLLLNSRRAIAINTNNEDGAFTKKIYTPSKKNTEKGANVSITAKELFTTAQQKFKDMSDSLSDDEHSSIIAYQGLVGCTERLMPRLKLK